MTDKHFAIVGGGIGGLTLATALQRNGLKVTIFESAPELRHLGAGLTLAGNAVKALAQIGIDQPILKAGKVLQDLFIKNQKGKNLSQTNAEKLTEKFGIVNSFSIHRADLQSILLNQLKAGTLTTGKKLLDFNQHSAGVNLFFEDGTSENCDYLIACDGIHSVVRKKLLPASSTRYAGYTCWRAVIDKGDLDIKMSETSETWGRGTRFGIVPLANNKVYWFACVNARQNDAEMRSYKVPDLLNYFGDFHAPIPELIKATKNTELIWGDIIDLKPITKFAFGKILIAGDAAHATTPNLGQGACMAIEDAAVLSNCLSDYSTVEDAFIQFERKRIARTTRIVNDSWLLGKIAQVENRLMAGLRNVMISWTPPELSERQMKFIVDAPLS